MEAWGFKYRSQAVWVKAQIGTGMWFRNRHEIIRFGRKGSGIKCPKPAPFTSVIEAPRTRHSQKPESLQDAIDKTYPDLAKLEMFARRERDGWWCWGDEIARG
jgi:N6-adenosine-specific RNA methylase IME4